MNNKDIQKIIKENKSLTKLEIIWKNKSNNCNLDNIEKKFPNIAELIINQDFKINNSKEINLEIIENAKSKINKLILNNIAINTKLYYNQFNNLVEIEININNKIKNLKDSFPIFGDKCKTIFRYLKSFHLMLINKNKLSMDILNNIYQNLDKMPALKFIILDFIVEGFNKDIYSKLINKLFSLKLIGYIRIGEDNIKENDKIILIKSNRYKNESKNY